MLVKVLAIPFLFASLIGTHTINIQDTMSLHDFTVTDIDGNDFEMSQLKGKKVMIVNVASECGFTPQYESLQELYNEFGGEKFEILAFPANNFGGQEPGTDAEIKSFCQKNYGVTFPVMSKISVKGDDKHPIYEFLTSKELNGDENHKVKWNFHKFLIDENGKVIEGYGSMKSPVHEDIIDWING